jgi:hypothetical protein
MCVKKFVYKKVRVYKGEIVRAEKASDNEVLALVERMEKGSCSISSEIGDVNVKRKFLL